MLNGRASPACILLLDGVYLSIAFRGSSQNKQLHVCQQRKQQETQKGQKSKARTKGTSGNMFLFARGFFKSGCVVWLAHLAHMCVCVCKYIYVYIYTERDTNMNINKDIYIHTNKHIYVYT